MISVGSSLVFSLAWSLVRVLNRNVVRQSKVGLLSRSAKDLHKVVDICVLGLS